MGKVEKYCDLLLQAGVPDFSGASNGEDLFINCYLHGSTLPAGPKMGAVVGDFAESAMNQNELAVIFSFEPHPVTFA